MVSNYTQNEQQRKAIRFLLYTGAGVHIPTRETVAGDMVFRITLKNGEQINVDDIGIADMKIDNQDSIRERKRILSFTSHGKDYAFVGREIDTIDILNRQPVIG